MMLRIYGLMPRRRIVFFTFRRCMSFHTPWTLIHRTDSVDEKTAMTMANASAIRRALENAGVELIDENGGGPVARLKQRLPNQSVPCAKRK
jgi:hypothetical protein